MFWVRTCEREVYKKFLYNLYDQDSADCKILKAKLLGEAFPNGEPNLPLLIRIVCKELEAWYWGDMDAIEQAYPRFRASNYRNKAKYRNPDALANAKEELKKILPELAQISTAQKIAPFMNLEQNSSSSFNHFLNGLRNFVPAISDDMI